MAKCDKCSAEVEKTFAVGEAKLCINCYLNYLHKDDVKHVKPQDWYPRRRWYWCRQPDEWIFG